MIRINTKITADLANFLKMRYGVDISAHEDTPEMMKAFMRLQYWMDEAILGKYFANNDNAESDGTYWSQQLNFETRKTGKELLKKLQTLNPTKILDVGCGDNEWKTHFGTKLVGIDPYNSNADHRIDIDSYTTGVGTWDVVMCLGSINFGDKNTIENQVAKAVNLCKPGGKLFFRLNPGITHDNMSAQWVDFYPWSEEKVHDLAARLECTVNEVSWDHPEVADNIRWGNRIYSEWTKPSFKK